LKSRFEIQKWNGLGITVKMQSELDPWSMIPFEKLIMVQLAISSPPSTDSDVSVPLLRAQHYIPYHI
jgi:hypothetical protein